MNKHKKRLSRCLCLQILYANEISNININDVIENFFNDSNNSKAHKYESAEIKYSLKIFKYATDNSESIDLLIKDKLLNWEMDRLAIVDKMLLRMSIAEMLYIDEIPPKVSITEAVEIAKEFSSQDSSGFINGVMDAVYNDNFKKVPEHNKQDMGKDISGCMDVAASNYNPEATVDDGSCKY